MQKKIGNNCETEFCNQLFRKGYWVYLFAYKVNGQPCDVIAVKNNKTILIDVKHCSGNAFSTSRIEPNQKTSFEHARDCGIENIGFAIFFESSKQYYWLPFTPNMKKTYKESELVLFDEVYNW